jgi:RNA polymerase sigma factor (sigma-70 family)
LIRRAKLDYFRKYHIPLEIISLEELREENMPISEDVWMRKMLFEEDDFCFEEERLAKAYAELPLLRKQILKLMYVDELEVKEIARLLNCSAQYVSNQKQKGLRHLRKCMMEGGEKHG